MVVSTGAAIISNFKINFVLTNLIKAQIFESLVMMGSGMVVALLYGVFTRQIRLKIRNKAVSGMCEIAFWVLTGILTCRFLFYATYGEINVHVICSFICGLFLWNSLYYATMTMGDGKCLNERKKEAESLKIRTK